MTEVTRSFATAGLVVISTTLAGCGSEGGKHVNGEIDFEPNQPHLMLADSVPVYEGDNPTVLAAQRQHRTGLELHRNVIIRTCGPTGGVCHNQKEFPDLHTPGNLLGAIDKPCNQESEWSTVFDGCESPGDRLRLDGDDGRGVEIGYIDYVPGEAEEYGDKKQPKVDSPGLHIVLATPTSIGDRASTWTKANLVRTFERDGELIEQEYAHFQSEWWLLEGGTHLFARVQEYQVDQVTELLSAGVEQGDRNRNGIYGARESHPLALLTPGAPEQSYLIGRLRGELGGQPIPGTRMPLANEPLTVADMLALYCFVEGIPPVRDGVLDLQTPINYASCRAAEDPEGLNLLGNGATWLGRVQPLLESNCGGCHGGAEPQSGFDILTDGLYERLLAPATQDPDMAYVTPGKPEKSYLWLKLTNAAGIIGQGMPIDPLEGVRTLNEGALADIETWILNGAFEEE